MPNDNNAGQYQQHQQDEHTPVGEGGSRVPKMLLMLMNEIS